MKIDNATGYWQFGTNNADMKYTTLRENWT